MREIKFRGKRIDNGEWVYGYYGTNGSGKEWIICPIILTEVHSFQYFEIISGTGGQFTGLHDKNNNPIYEGDLGKVHHGDPFAPEVIVEVIFKDGAFGIIPLKSEIDIFGNKYSGGMLPFYDGYKPDNFEVIGNIYESPLVK